MLEIRLAGRRGEAAWHGTHLGRLPMPEKYEQEIDEIMGKVGDLGPRRPLRQHFKEAQRRIKEQVSLELPKLFRWITPTFLGGLGAVLLVLGLVMRQTQLVIVAFGLMLGAYFLSITRGKASHSDITGYDKSWRGRPIDEQTPRKWRNPFRKWFGRKDD